VRTPQVPGADSAPVIACELGADQLGAQAERWVKLGRDAGLERVETRHGLRIRFRDDPAVEHELRLLVAVEGTCCSWARWEVHRDHGELVVDVSSTAEGGAVALHAMFGSGGPAAGDGDGPRPPGNQH
jgi:hypothetical protein